MLCQEGRRHLGEGGSLAQLLSGVADVQNFSGVDDVHNFSGSPCKTFRGGKLFRDQRAKQTVQSVVKVLQGAETSGTIKSEPQKVRKVLT